MKKLERRIRKLEKMLGMQERAPRETRSAARIIDPAGLYRIDQFIPSFIGIGRTLWYCGVRHGKLPAPVVRGARMTLWRGEDILQAAKAIATTRVLAEIRELKKD